MPRPCVFRSPRARLPVTTAAAAIVLFACNAPSSSGNAPAETPSASAGGSGSAAANASPSGAAPSASAASNDPEDFKPSHPGHVHQRDGKGGYLAALTAPPVVPNAPIKPTVFDNTPEEVKTAPPKAENGHCGELDLGGGDKVELDCMTDDYSMVAGASKPTATSAEMASFRSNRKLPSVVDHRKDGTEGPVISQGKTGACTAFSLVTAADHSASHAMGRAPSLSPMHAWARYHSPKMGLAEHDNVGKGLTDLETLPFDAKLANEWAKGHKHVDHELLHKADANAVVEISSITRLDTGSMTEIKQAIAANQDIWFSIKGAHGLQHPKKGADGESMVGDFDYRKGGSGGHAIVLAGYQDTAKGTYFLIHNSWGPKWGTDGYAWIWEKTLRNNISEAYIVHARPTDSAHARRPEANHRLSNCHNGTVPDAITTECVPACGDGGPRVNGVCPTAGQCPEGEVNLVGKCELAAPAMNMTLANGVKVKCGISGCTYVVPSGQESCSSEKGCTISCPAPRFMLSTGSHGLSCNG